ncbi:restriction endonuclease subunit S [Phocaeicola vulgatus]|uniref:Restriction endonuclease subunit S n=6 Tax=Bacteroidales TaxID=171549 RepID=A0ABW9S6Y8_9BACT|nr:MULTISPECIES: restriction endonuclease subunit S [Bacteroidales]KAA3714510.1 restriction endonuclease subunit S [Bacteroides salyersiae]KAA3770342.1 restriction endonuclease subunit S [Bacteroides salyersiae]MDB8903241.1 restriction endonuclease subunit S [Parabacteroides merdae]MTU34265.1 restriction endonuclease subunit S [Parabacteroides merdae]MTU38187.1 restriction endonuclease subunit S [Parabacteroides merdae]
MDTKALRQKILDLAIHGKLVPQDPNDEPASVLLERIKAEKERLIKEGKIKRSKKSAKTSDTPHYENVPFEVPSSWVWCRLDDIVSFQGGYAYKSNTYVNQSDWQVIRIGNVKNDNLILDIQPVFVEDVIGKTTEKYLLKKDDILFTMTGTKGKRDYFYTAKVPSIKKNLLLNQRVGCLRCFSSEINIDFLCLVLKGEYVLDAIFSTETGNVSQGNIGSESTLNLNIAIPPLTEQHRIVVEIEKWFALIDQIEQGKSDLQSTIKQTKSKILDLAIHGKLVPQDPNDEPASELLKRINPNFTPCDNGHYTQLPEGWTVAPMQVLCSLVDGDKQNGIERTNLDVKYLRGERDAKTLTSGKYVTANSLLILVDGENSGEVFRTPIDGYQGSTFKQLLINENMNEEYVLQIINLHRKVLRESKVGSAIPHLNKKLFKAIEVPIPSYKEQQRIVMAINIAFKQLDLITESL